VSITPAPAVRVDDRRQTGRSIVAYRLQTTDVSDNADLVDLSIQQFAGAWRVMCAAAPGASIAAIDDIHYIFSGSTIAFFNIALVTERGIGVDRLKAHVEHARAWASAEKVPWLFVVTNEALASGVDATAVLEGCEFAPTMTLIGMLAQHVAPLTTIPNGLELTMPTDDAGCSAILDVNGLAYGLDLEAGKDLVGTCSFWARHFPVLGLIDGKPVCSAAVLMVDGYRYVALVATDPAHQRQGYAEAAMRRALELSANVHHERPTVLHATEAGRPIYERMGYKTIAAHTIYTDKAFLSSALQ
jgi:GNAT superfamily N-acetyltransferase